MTIVTNFKLKTIRLYYNQREKSANGLVVYSTGILSKKESKPIKTLKTLITNQSMLNSTFIKMLRVLRK